MRDKNRKLNTTKRLSKKESADLLFLFMLGNSVREAVVAYNGVERLRVQDGS